MKKHAVTSIACSNLDSIVDCHLALNQASKSRQLNSLPFGLHRLAHVTLQHPFDLF